MTIEGIDKDFQTGSKSKREYSLDFLKGVCAILIILTHSQFAAKYRDTCYFFPLVVDLAVPIFMVISGYVNCLTMEHKEFRECYEKKTLKRKLSRVILPFIPCALVSIFFWIFIDKVGFTWTCINIIFQRWGQGGYYPIIMIQFVLLFPWILKLSKRVSGQIMIILIDVGSELIFNVGGVFRDIQAFYLNGPTEYAY